VYETVESRFGNVGGLPVQAEQFLVIKQMEMPALIADGKSETAAVEQPSIGL